MKEIDLKLRSYLGKKLRRVYQYSPVKAWAKKVHVTCIECGGVDNIEIDHKEPVAPVDREIGAVEYFKRMFCLDENGHVDLSNTVGLCVSCHKKKSKLEMALRAKHKTGPYSERSKEKRRKKAERKRKRRGKRK